MIRQQSDLLSAPLLSLVNEIEDELLRKIAGQLVKDKDISDISKWRIRQLARAGKLTKESISLINSYAEAEKGEFSDALYTAAMNEISYVDKAVQYAAKKGLVSGSTDIPADETAMNALLSFQKQAYDDINMVNTVMGYQAGKAYTSAVNSIYDTAHKELSKGAGKLALGTDSFQSAVRQAVVSLAQNGITGFVDKLGRSWSPESYVSMDLRTTLANTANAAQWSRCDEYNVNLISVDSHNGARPLCSPYQGKIYSRDNSSGTNADTSGRKIYYTPLSQTSYGKPAGLFGINCGHSSYPFIPGVNIQRFFPYDEKENAERYKEFQHQRQLERKIRKNKRECMMMNEVGDKEGFSQASVKLKTSKEEYKAYSNAHGLTVHNDRTQVYGFDKSVSGKSVWSGKKAQSANKMASESIDWSKALPIKHTPEEMVQITEYAKSKNIKIYLPNTFDGDIEMLKEHIDNIENICSEYSIKQKITIRFDTMLDEDYAETKDNTISFNKNVLRNREVTNKALNADNYLAATDFTGISTHEMGHIIAQKYGEKGLDIAKKAYYNVYNEEISTSNLLGFLRNNISLYSVHLTESEKSKPVNRQKRKEIIPEVLTKSNSSENNEFSEEFIKILKEEYL